MLRNLDTGDVIEHFNDRHAANHYRMMLATNFVPVFQNRCYEHMREWVLQQQQCRDEVEEEDNGQEQ